MGPVSKSASSSSSSPSSSSSSPSTYSMSHSRNGNRSAANERERKRMQSLSRAFTTLRAVIPWIPSDTKLSKLDTLTAAIDYISCLNEILQVPSASSDAITEDPIQLIAQHRKTWLTSIKSNSVKWKRVDGDPMDAATFSGQVVEREDNKSDAFALTWSSGSDETCCRDKECKCISDTSASVVQWSARL